MVYRVNETQTLKRGPSPLIVLPLSVITAFCFVFILIATPRPAAKTGQEAASTQSTPLTRQTQQALPEVSFASPATLTKLSQPSDSSQPQTTPATVTPAVAPATPVVVPAPALTLSNNSTSSDKQTTTSKQKESKKKYWWQR